MTEKHCNTCASSYYVEEKGMQRQHCRNRKYNSVFYTEKQYLEDRGSNHCRFWTPRTQKGESK